MNLEEARELAMWAKGDTDCFMLARTVLELADEVERLRHGCRMALYYMNRPEEHRTLALEEQTLSALTCAMPTEEKL